MELVGPIQADGGTGVMVIPRGTGMAKLIFSSLGWCTNF